MAAGGINTVRIPHTMPPLALLDAAHNTVFALWSGSLRNNTPATSSTRTSARRREWCAQSARPAPATRRFSAMRSATKSRPHCALDRPPRVEQFMERLYRAAKDEDPGASSPMSTILRPSICSCLSSIWWLSTSIWRSQERSRGLSCSPAKHRRRPPAAHERRSAWTACVTARRRRRRCSTGRSGRLLRRLRGRFRLCLDRRVAPRRP